MRLFLAVDPGERLRLILTPALDAWRERLDLKWVRPENLHVTLRFLGDWPDDRLEPLKDTVRTTLRGRTSFPVTPGGFGVFPHWRSPRVLFLHLDDGGELADLATAVSGGIDARLPGVGAPAGPFRAHLTLARFRRDGGRIGEEAFRRLDPPPLPSFPADAVRLVESRLRPEGPEYVEREVFPLAAPTGI